MPVSDNRVEEAFQAVWVGFCTETGLISQLDSAEMGLIS